MCIRDRETELQIVVANANKTVLLLQFDTSHLLMENFVASTDITRFLSAELLRFNNIEQLDKTLALITVICAKLPIFYSYGFSN